MLMSHWSYSRDAYYLNSTSRPSVPDFASNFTNCVLPLEKGAAAFYINIDNPMTACNYRAEKDNASGQQKVVFILSTCHQPAPGKCSLEKCTKAKSDKILQHTHGRCGSRGSTIAWVSYPKKIL